jgi:hypothetical protein
MYNKIVENPQASFLPRSSQTNKADLAGLLVSTPPPYNHVIGTVQNRPRLTWATSWSCNVTIFLFSVEQPTNINRSQNLTFKQFLNTLHFENTPEPLIIGTEVLVADSLSSIPS